MPKSELVEYSPIAVMQVYGIAELVAMKQHQEETYALSGNSIVTVVSDMVPATVLSRHPNDLEVLTKNIYEHPDEIEAAIDEDPLCIAALSRIALLRSFGGRESAELVQTIHFYRARKQIVGIGLVGLLGEQSEPTQTMVAARQVS